MKPQTQSITASGLRKALRKLVSEGVVRKVPGVNPKTGRAVWVFELTEKSLDAGEKPID